MIAVVGQRIKVKTKACS